MELQITRWVQGTGVQFVSMVNAAQLASCCGASLQLPSTFIFGPIDTTKFGFPTPSKLNQSFCRSARGNSDKFFYKPIPYACRTLHHRSQAYHLANRYSGLPIKCTERFGTVAHVRTLDMDPSESVHSGYGQPPFSFYLRAWNHTGDPLLHVVHKDLSSPVARAFEVLRRSGRVPITMHSHREFDRDLRVLLCAEHLIMSHSSLVFMVAMNPHLKRIYQYEDHSRGPWRPLSFSCETTQYHTTKRITSPWLATNEQKLDLVLANPPDGFEQSSACLQKKGQTTDQDARKPSSHTSLHWRRTNSATS